MSDGLRDELMAQGGLCAPIDDAYVFQSQPGRQRLRPLRDALEAHALRWSKRGVELFAFDLEHYGCHASAPASVAAQIAEWPINDSGSPWRHEWDEPIFLHYVR